MGCFALEVFHLPQQVKLSTLYRPSLLLFVFLSAYRTLYYKVDGEIWTTRPLTVKTLLLIIQICANNISPSVQMVSDTKGLSTLRLQCASDPDRLRIAVRVRVVTKIM